MEGTSAIDRLRASTGLQLLSEFSERKQIDGWNPARNAGKHWEDPKDQPVRLNGCDEAYWMVRRALANTQKLGIPVAAAQDFENCVIVNINM